MDDEQGPLIDFGTSHAWKVVAARVNGPIHEKQGTRCDDSFAFSLFEDWIVAAVCDGAGSAAKGGLGSRIASQVVTECLTESIRDRTPSQSLRALVEAAVSAARTRIHEEATDAGLSIRDYHTTIIGVIARGGKGIFFHIGDGAGVCFDNGGVDQVGWRQSGISRPENGEFAETTYFLTEDSWREHLKYERVKACDAIALMTDGVTPFALAKGELAADLEFFSAINSFLIDHSSKDGAKSVHKLLNGAPCRKANQDDKTLIWISNQINN